jgi:hypothetical protein
MSAMNLEEILERKGHKNEFLEFPGNMAGLCFAMDVSRMDEMAGNPAVNALEYQVVQFAKSLQRISTDVAFFGIFFTKADLLLKKLRTKNFSTNIPAYTGAISIYFRNFRDFRDLLTWKTNKRSK